MLGKEEMEWVAEKAIELYGQTPQMWAVVQRVVDIEIAIRQGDK